MRAFYPAGAPQLPGFAAPKTYAAHPVYKNSAREEIKFAPLTKREAVKIFHRAYDWERATAITRRDAYGKITRQGKIGRMGLLVLHSLLFNFINYKSGRLDPSYQAIAAKACVSVRSVARALVKLKDAGVLNWVRRCRETKIDGRYTLEQDTNAYGVAPPSLWRGFWSPPPAPPPDPQSWGRTPMDPPAAGQAAAALAAGDRRQAQRLLESDPGDGLAVALGRLGRARGHSA